MLNFWPNLIAYSGGACDSYKFQKYKVGCRKEKVNGIRSHLIRLISVVFNKKQNTSNIKDEKLYCFFGNMKICKRECGWIGLLLLSIGCLFFHLSSPA